MTIEMNDELRAKLLKTSGADEVSSILAGAGQQATAEEIERIVAEVQYAAEHDGEHLSLDELDAVAGGGWIQNYNKSGCVATVEYNSDCWGEDGGCAAIHNTYYCQPVNVRCPKCGDKYMYKHNTRWIEGGQVGILRCPYCGTTKEVDIVIWDGLIPG